MNLYVNASQAMPRGGQLHLETENVVLDEGYVRPYEVKPGRYVKLSVADTGVGMDQETLRRVFEPFFTTKEMGRGTGLGLASVYGIVKSHGGVIDVYSKKGQGTTFSIYLPASEKAAIAAGAEEDESDGILEGNETVLLVDDEEMVIAVGRNMLENLGYKVLAAKGGRKPCRSLRKKKMRLIW